MANQSIENLSAALEAWVKEQTWVSSTDEEAVLPDVEDFAKFIADHLKAAGLEIRNAEVKTEEVKLPALLKSPVKESEKTNAQRMRELAGIPHKGNFV